MKFLKSSGQIAARGLKIAGLAVMGLVLLAGGLQMSGNENTVRVTIKESGTSITLHPGDQLEVTLPATLGTGYSWKVAQPAENVLKLHAGPETAPAENSRQSGKTEYQVFRFMAASKGTGQLVLHYVRPWQTEKPAKEFSLTVKVQ